MAVMQVRPVRMRVQEPLMRVAMHVSPGPSLARVLVQVMAVVVLVLVLVFDRLVRVEVVVPAAVKQPDRETQQGGRGQV